MGRLNQQDPVLTSGVRVNDDEEGLIILFGIRYDVFVYFSTGLKLVLN